MPTVNETIKALQEIVALNPKFGEYETVYSVDDEGNEYNKVYSIPCLTQVYSLQNYRNLELIGFYAEGQNDIALEDCNCVIIN